MNTPPHAQPAKLRFLSMLRAVRRDPGVRAATFSFALTRSLVLLLFILTAQTQIIEPDDPTFNARETYISLRRIPFARTIRERVGVGVRNWYMGIARDGYERLPFTTEQQYNWAFFPLFPLTLRLAAQLTGEFSVTGLMLSHLFWFGALILLYKLVIEFGFEPPDARRAVFYLAACPVSYFFSLPVTESLFLLLTVGCFYAATREGWWLAGLLGALASATRITGVLLLPALILLYWQTYHTFRPRLNMLPLLLIPSGLLAFMCFLYRITGNPLAFKDITVAWGRRPGFFLWPLWAYLRDPLSLAVPWDFRLINFTAAATALVCGLILLKGRRWPLAFYTLASSFVALTSGLLQSQARYALVMFPAFIVLAVAGRNARFDQTWRTASLILLVLMTLMYCYRLDVALS